MTKHRMGTIVGSFALALLLLAVNAAAAVDARLEGRFKINGVVTGTDVQGQNVGDKFQRTYKFKPLCPSGVCDEVKIARETSNGTVVKTTLSKVDVGVYEGEEVQTNPDCADGSDATSRTGDIHVEITRKEHGKAFKIKGTLHFDVTGCQETYQDADFKGRLRS